jgi:membrane protein implicated in regulation of membrane protease activity
MGGTTHVNVFREYGLSLVLALFFVLSWLVQTVAGWVEFVAEQTTHGETPAVFGDSGYVWPWLQATFENWQSEFLQLFTFVVLTAILIHRKSHESRDDQDKQEQEVQEILRTVHEIRDRQETAK